MNHWFPTVRRIAGPWHTTRTQSQALLRLIAVATEENLPLSPLLESWAADERGVQRRRVFRLAREVAAGKPLPDAIEAVPRVLRDEDLLAIRFDAKLGLRTAAIREIVNESRGTGRAGVRIATLYFSVIFPIGLAIVAFLHFGVMPKLRQIFARLELKQPEVIEWSQQVTSLLLSWLPTVGLLVLAVFWLAFATRMGRRARRALFSRLLAPGSDWISADVLRKLALAATAGRPIAGVLSTLARYHFDPGMRHKLLFVRNEVEQGADLLPSLAAVGLLAAPELRLLETAERVGNRPWALVQLADVRKARATRRRDRFAALLLPAIVVGMGLLVLVQSLTVFMPLTELINAL